MTYTPFSVTISNVTGALFRGSAASLTVPSVGGIMTVLKGHEPSIALLGKGSVRVTDEAGATHEYPVESGLLEVSNNAAIVLL